MNPNADANDAPNADANDAPNADTNDAPNADANDAPNADANDAPNANPNADANDARVTRVCVVFPYGTNAASHEKGLNTVVRWLADYGFIARVTPDRRDVLNLTPTSTGCIETLLTHPNRIRGMDTTFNWYVSRFENIQCSICLECLDNEHSTEIPCEHEFHTRCLEKWATVCSSHGRQLSCPLCRAT